MKTLKIALFLCLPLLIGACKGKKAENQAAEEAAIAIEMAAHQRAAGAPQDLNELKTDFMGTFTGTLPCADCQGILTTLTLNADETYTLEMLYQGKAEEQVVIEKGKWTPSEDLTLIELNYDKPGEAIFYALINKNTLEKLDNNAKPIISELNHRLVRK